MFVEQYRDSLTLDGFSGSLNQGHLFEAQGEGQVLSGEGSAVLSVCRSHGSRISGLKHKTCLSRSYCCLAVSIILRGSQVWPAVDRQPHLSSYTHPFSRAYLKAILRLCRYEMYISLKSPCRTSKK